MKRLVPMLLALLPIACANDGHLCVLGYTTKPNYDTRFRTVRVPMIKNHSTWVVTPVVGFEEDLHKALIDQVQLVTPYKVVQNDPDTELSVVVRSVAKNLLNYTPFNTVREAELVVVVDVIWRDLRSGEILSRSARRPGQAGPADVPQPLLMDGIPPIGDVPDRPDRPTRALGEKPPADPLARTVVTPISLRVAANFREELGESTSTALQTAIKKIARQITQAMEPGW